MVHGGVLLVPAAPHRVNHLQVQARAAPALPPWQGGGKMEMMEMLGSMPTSCQPWHNTPHWEGGGCRGPARSAQGLGGMLVLTGGL